MQGALEAISFVLLAVSARSQISDRWLRTAVIADRILFGFKWRYTTPDKRRILTPETMSAVVCFRG